MITAGLTGGICCGKSTVTKTFRANNIPVVDADIVAREVVAPGTIGLEKIISTFGKEFLQEDGTLDRTTFGKLIFSDPTSRSKLDHIMAPLIDAEATIQLNKFHDSGHPIVIWDAALIVEMGNASKYRPLIVVSCPQEIQIKRLMLRNNLSHSEAMSRINSQLSLEKKIALADYVVDTSKEIEYSISQTINIIEILKNKQLPAV